MQCIESLGSMPKKSLYSQYHINALFAKQNPFFLMLKKGVSKNGKLPIKYAKTCIGVIFMVFTIKCSYSNFIMFKFNFIKICDEQKIWEHEKTRKGRNICFISGGLKSLVDMSYIAYEAKEYFFFTLCELHEDY